MRSPRFDLEDPVHWLAAWLAVYLILLALVAVI